MTMTLKGFDQLGEIKSTVENNHEKLLQARQKLFNDFENISNEYSKNVDAYISMKPEITALINQAVPLFNTEEVTNTQIKSIEALLTQLQTLFRQEATPSVKEDVVNVSANDNEVDVVSADSLESYQADLLEQVKTSLSNRAFFKENHLTHGLRTLGMLRVMYQHWYRAFQQFKKNPQDKKLTTLLDKHYNKIQDLIEDVNEEVLNFHKLHSDTVHDDSHTNSEIIVEANQITASTSIGTTKEPLVLDNLMRIEEKEDILKPYSGLSMVGLPAAEKVEIEAVHQMEDVVSRIEIEMSALEKLASWRPASEVGNVTAMINQFKRTITSYYVQPSATLFERLKNTLHTIETLHREAKEAGVDMVAMLADVESFEGDLPRLERLPSTNDFERNNLRAFIENFRSLYARYTRAEAGEEKNILVRQLVKMHSNIKEAYVDATASILEKTEEANVAAVQLSEGILTTEARQEVHIAPTANIEAVANWGLAPKTKMRLGSNRKLIAALLLVTASVINPNKLSEYSENAGVASVKQGSSLSEFGAGAKWGGEASINLPVAIDDVTKEEVRIPVRPYTSEVAEKESSTASTIDRVGVEVPETNFVTTTDTEVVAVPSTDKKGGQDSYVPEALVIPETHDATSTFATGEPEFETRQGDVLDLDPKSSAYQETIASPEVVPSDNNVVEVFAGNEATYPDRAINSIFAAVDSTGIPEVLANKLRAEEKEAFLSDANRLRAAGVGSGQKNVTFPGEKINYSDPVARLEQRFNEYRQYLSVPHTEVAVEGDNLTKLVEKSYARDLAVLSPADRLPVVEEALSTYLATPGALENLKLKDKDTVPIAAVVPLQVLARYLADAVAKKVLTANESGSASEVLVDDSSTAETIAVDVDATFNASEESGSTSEVIEDRGEPGEVTSPEEYPGGVIAFSQTYNQLLESFGIAIKAPAMFDSWFTVNRAEYNNRELLGMTVGEITTIMMQDPVEVMRELNARKISPEAANAVYQLVIEARKNGLAPYATDSTITLEEVIKRKVLADASTNK